MERNFTNENLEQFLRQNAEGLRMRPSEKVWKGISNHLNRRRRRFGFFLAVSLLISTTTGYFVIENTQQSSKSGGLQKAADKVAPGSLNSRYISPREVNDLQSAITKRIKREASVSQPSSRLVIDHPAILKAPVDQLNNSEEPLPTQQDASPNVTNSFTSTIVDDSYPLMKTRKEFSLSAQPLATDPLTIESVVNSYRGGKKKIGLQLYFTPTVSYRQLSENKAYIKTVSPTNIPFSQQGLYSDINSEVTHKPDLGFEIGLAAKYPVSKNLKIRGGLQFSLSRYDIRVFNSFTQLATIRLNDRNRLDSVQPSTNYSNKGGYKQNWLENSYFQVSAPVGVELILKGDDKVQFGIASTVQPTYILGDRAYLISSDYQSYAEVPWLIRRWNVNTNLETFVSYSTGQLKWQVGPQVRYQLLSSFVKKYPVKENLFDFGLKVGISLNKE